MMKATGTRLLLGGAAATALIGLAACGGGSDGATTVPEPPALPQGAQRFGAGFATSFNAAPNSDAREPNLSDIIPLSLTTDPFEVP